MGPILKPRLGEVTQQNKGEKKNNLMNYNCTELGPMDKMGQLQILSADRIIGDESEKGCTTTCTSLSQRKHLSRKERQTADNNNTSLLLLLPQWFN